MAADLGIAAGALKGAARGGLEVIAESMESGVECLDLVTGGLGAAAAGLGRFKDKGPSDEEELGRSMEFRSNGRFLETGVSEDECDNVRECLDACDIVRMGIKRMYDFLNTPLKLAERTVGFFLKVS